MTENKRFKLLYSQLDNGMFVDKEKQFKDIIVDKEFQKIGLIKLVDLLNNLADENEQLKKQITSLSVELDTHKHPLWSTREAEKKISELTDLLMNETRKNAILLEEINSLRIENMRLKEVQKYE